MSRYRMRQFADEPKSSTRLSNPKIAETPHSITADPTNPLLQMQQRHGNQHVQRYLATQSAVQREPDETTGEPAKPRSMWQRVEDFFTGESEPEKMLEELNEGIERSQKLCERASWVVSDAKAAERLKEASEKFESLHGTLEKGLNVVGTGRDITHFVQAARKLDSIDIATNQEEAAKQFDALFGAVGNLAQKLPEGPWSFYFEFLSKFEEYHFFSNMRAKIDPSVRWKDRFKEIGME